MNPEATLTNEPPTLIRFTTRPLCIYHVLNGAGMPMAFLYCTDPEDAHAWLENRPTHFDVRRLPSHCLEHLDIDPPMDFDLDDTAAFEAAVTRRKGFHYEAICRAISSGVPLGKRAQAEHAEAMTQLARKRGELRVVARRGARS